MYDNHKNLAYSLITAAPDPKDSGTSLTIVPGDDTDFPTVPFNCTVWPLGEIPTQDNAEIVRVTAKTSNVFTITRAQESTTAKSISTGWQIANAPTVKTFTDLEGQIDATVVPDSNGSDDTSAIQTILNSGGRIVFKAGQTWLIDATVGLFPVSNSHIVIEKGATLQVITNSVTTYRLFNITAVSNIVIDGFGTLKGDLTTHGGDHTSASQQGHLIFITNGSSNITVKNITCTLAWGDGIYMGGTSPVSNILIDGVTSTDNRRENIAPFWGSNIEIRNCNITLAGFTAESLGWWLSPASGIDCEPNNTESMTNLRIINNYIDSNQGCGIYASQNSGTISGLVIRGNLITNNGISTHSLTTYQWNGIHVAVSFRAQIIDNIVKTTGTDGLVSTGVAAAIMLRGTQRCVIKGGYLQGNLGRGIFLSTATFTDISGVTIQENNYQGITAFKSDSSMLVGCRIIDNMAINPTPSKAHIEWSGTIRGVISRNEIKGNKGTYWIDLETSGSTHSNDNIVVDNTGLATDTAAPNAGTGIYNDSGTTNLWARNITKTAGGNANWTTDGTLNPAVVGLSATVITATNASWTIPTGATTLEVICVGGGGGSGGSAGSTPSQIGPGGGGGGAGGITTAIMSVGGASTLNVTIGAGGTAGVAGTINQGVAGGNGGQGGTTSVANATTSQTVSATGGGPGLGGANGTSTGTNGGIYGSNNTAALTRGVPGFGGASGGSNAVGVVGGSAVSYGGSAGGGGGGANAGTANGSAGASGTLGGVGGAGGANGGDAPTPTAPAANTGAGAGGAGGTKTVASTGAVGTAGAIGGSGYVVIKVVG